MVIERRTLRKCVYYIYVWVCVFILSLFLNVHLSITIQIFAVIETFFSFVNLSKYVYLSITCIYVYVYTHMQTHTHKLWIWKLILRIPWIEGRTNQSVWVHIKTATMSDDQQVKAHILQTCVGRIDGSETREDQQTLSNYWHVHERSINCGWSEVGMMDQFHKVNRSWVWLHDNQFKERKKIHS